VLLFEGRGGDGGDSGNTRGDFLMKGEQSPESETNDISKRGLGECSRRNPPSTNQGTTS